MRAAGGTPKDKIHVAYGYGLFTGGLGAHYGAERPGATVIPMSGGQTEKQAQLIRDFQPDMIMVTPSYCLNLIEELERQLGGDASGCSLRVGVFGAEPWTQAMRKEIERRLGITALDIYGLSEVMGPGSRWSVWKLPTAQPFGKIISILKLLIPMTAHRLPMANMANCYSPR